MKRTLQMLNELEQEGVFSRYAIGGAMAATFYAEPTLTFDLDVFVFLQPDESGLISVAPIYEALRARGYDEQQECVLIESVPVQFLPAYNALVEEALEQGEAGQLRKHSHACSACGTSPCHLRADRTRQGPGAGPDP